MWSVHGRLTKVSRTAEDWAAILDRFLAGDEVAFLELSRLVTGFLVRWRAYDFRDEWPDLVQEVLLAVLKAAREGRLRNPDATVGYVRTIAHHKLMDRLRVHLRPGDGQSPAWPPDDAVEAAPDEHQPPPEVVVDVRRALDNLPEKQRKVVFAKYGQGRTAEQVAKDTGIPLGTVKRYLRDGLSELRRSFSVALESG